jgi:hypothetical protein
MSRQEKFRLAVITAVCVWGFLGAVGGVTQQFAPFVIRWRVVSVLLRAEHAAYLNCFSRAVEDEAMGRAPLYQPNDHLSGGHMAHGHHPYAHPCPRCRGIGGRNCSGGFTVSEDEMMKLGGI